MHQKILFIGGGTGGHILPLKNLIENLVREGIECHLIVNDAELDKKIVQENFKHLSVSFFKTGKIRRYLSWHNIPDGFKILHSIVKARSIIKELRPDVIFFKGGFVNFPFFVALKYTMQWQGKIAVHESDISAGFMTQWIKKSADFVFESFDAHSPCPLFFSPEGDINCQSLKTLQKRPQILILGGSQGSEFINTLILQNRDALVKQFSIRVITGVGKAIPYAHENFEQHEILTVKCVAQAIQDADLIISRAGANSLFEIVSAKKPSIIIPLPSVARNHQMLNAQFFKHKNLCKILEQTPETSSKLIPLITETLKNTKLKKELLTSNIQNGASHIAQTLKKALISKN